MKLKEFPHVIKACGEIMWDQPHPTHQGRNINVLDPEADIPTQWLDKVSIAENVLGFLEPIPFGKLFPSYDGDELTLDESAAAVVAMGHDDWSEKVMDKAGFSGEWIAATNEVLNQYFDGELRYVFQPILAEIRR